MKDANAEVEIYIFLGLSSHNIKLYYEKFKDNLLFIMVHNKTVFL